MVTLYIYMLNVIHVHRKNIICCMVRTLNLFINRFYELPLPKKNVATENTLSPDTHRARSEKSREFARNSLR